MRDVGQVIGVRRLIKLKNVRGAQFCDAPFLLVLIEERKVVEERGELLLHNA